MGLIRAYSYLSVAARGGKAQGGTDCAKEPVRVTAVRLSVFSIFKS